MENRSHALLAGLFTVLLAIATVAAALWLNQDRTELIPYDLVSTDSVEGLAPQADVKYRGLPVGRVESVGFDPQNPGGILVRIGVRPGTPMTSALTATVTMKGITGVAFVDLDDDGEPGKPLNSSPENVLRIPMRPGLAERVMERANELMSVVEGLGHRVDQLLGDENQQALTKTLTNTAEATRAVRDTLDKLSPALADVGPMVRSLNATANDASNTAREISRLADEARASLVALRREGGLLEQASGAVTRLDRAAGQLAGATLPKVGNMAAGVERAAETASRALQELGDSPQSLLFGPAPVRPGPGEPGFAGFGQR